MAKRLKIVTPPAHPHPLPEIFIRHCNTLADYAACIQVERAAWGSADIDIVPLPVFVVAAETGGQVLGAFDGDRMVGFTLALGGIRNRRPFLHSHMTAVLDPYRNHGVGRRLKLFQREDALNRGIELIEWTFDPMELKNAHFNFRLGAIARRFLPNLYGLTTSPLHGGLPTDRLVAEWWLRSARVQHALSNSAKPVVARKRAPKKGEVRIRIPVEFARVKGTDLDEAARLQAELRLEFEHWLGLGYAAIGIEFGDAKRDETDAEYVLQPWE